MTLTQNERMLVEELESQGGEEWNRFRARRNKYKRENNATLAEATRVALEPLMQSNVIDMNARRTPEPDPDTLEFWRPFIFPAFCAIMLTIITGYQVHAQRSLYGSGNEGILLSAMLEVTLTALALVRTNSLMLSASRYLLIGLLVGHIAQTMDTAAQRSAMAQNPEIQRLQQRFDNKQLLLNETPVEKNRVRIGIAADMDKIDLELKAARAALESGTIDRLTGSTEADIRTRIRWINLFAQLFFAHLVALQFSRLDLSRLTRLR